jgi:hypothetical protein
MKKFAISLLVLALAFGVAANAGVRVVGGYSLADKVDTSGFSFTYTGAAFLGAEYVMPLNKSFDLGFGGNYVFGRSTAGTTSTLSFIDLLANAYYNVSDKIYVLGGLNYSIPSVSNAPASVTYGGKLGVQVGAGYKVANNISVEAAYRVLGFDATVSGTNVVYSVNGLEVAAKYAF